jgi:tetratricopeptide (TPR) repeat protein
MTQENCNYGRDQFNINNPHMVSIVQQGQRETLYSLDSIPPSVNKPVERRLPEDCLKQWIAERSSLIGIVGESGFGKTTLAAWSLVTFKPDFDRVLWVNCGSVTSFEELAGWILQEMNILVRRDSQWTAAKFAQALMQQLREQRCLIVLDRFEVLAGDLHAYAAFLADWKARGKNSTVVLTMQQEMELAAQWLRLTGVEPIEGSQLLQNKGILDDGQGFRSQLSEAASGHPLLLELAANWVKKERTEATIALEDLTFFQQVFRQYEGNLEAQVEEVFLNLFGRLPSELQQFLMDVSVFRIRFDEAMAQAMLPTVTVAELQELTEQAFFMGSLDDRWSLHPLIARFVREESRRLGREAGAHERSIAYFWNRRQPWTGEFEDCRAELETFYHLCELKQYAEANRVMDTCVEILNRQGYYAKLTPIYKQLTQEWQPSNEEEVRNVGAAWTRLGNLYQSLGQYEAAITSHEKTQALSLEISDRRGEAISLGNLGIAYRSLGQYQCAIKLYQQQGNIAREIDDRGGEAASLGNLGNAYHSLGQYQCAIKLYQHSLDIACAISDRGSEANSLGNLGGAYDSLGQYQRALKFHQQSLDIARAISDRGGEAISLFNLGNALAKLNRSVEARQHFEQAKQIYKALDLDFEVEKCDTALQRLSKIRIPFWVYFLVGLAIVLLIWWLKR